MNKENKNVVTQQPILARLALMMAFVLPSVSAHLVAQPKAASEPGVLISEEGQFFVNAAWSPDGETLAFSSANFNGIWLADASGTNIRLLTADEAAGFGFSWSPDGKHILARTAVTENRRRFHQVKVYDVENASYVILQEKTRQLKGLPVFTPDGSQVAMIMDNNLELKSVGQKPAFRAANDASVVYPVDHKMISTQLASRQSKEVANFEGRFIFNPRLSPDGKKVVFQVQGKGLYVVNTDGSGLTHLGHGEYASWMPKSDYVVVSMVEDNGHVITGGELYAINVNTGESHHLTAHTEITALKPAVSPDGQRVAFDNPDDGNIYIMELE